MRTWVRCTSCGVIGTDGPVSTMSNYAKHDHRNRLGGGGTWLTDCKGTWIDLSNEMVDAIETLWITGGAEAIDALADQLQEEDKKHV